MTEPKTQANGQISIIVDVFISVLVFLFLDMSSGKIMNDQRKNLKTRNSF